MATKKSVWALFGILVISSFVLGSVIQAGSETMKFRIALTVTKDERMPLDFEEGRGMGMNIGEGLAFFENGEIAKVKAPAIFTFQNKVPRRLAILFSHSMTVPQLQPGSSDKPLKISTACNTYHSG
jgi:hypothetical protein